MEDSVRMMIIDLDTFVEEDLQSEWTVLSSSDEIDDSMASLSSTTGYKLLTGTCPDEQCKATLFFPPSDSSIECTSCGQRHSKERIRNVKVVTDHKVALHNLLKNVLLGKFKPKKGTDSVKVLGVSNYQCKLLSPLLTNYGMDKSTGKAKLLMEMTPPKEHFDCSVLADRSFLIEPENIGVMGYGRDRTGSMIYLSDMLTVMKKFNGGEEVILPIHADGDGHCLVHALSRALIGRELFWHALRENLKHHLLIKLDEYKALFADFVESTEWNHIIDECDPNFLPVDGDAMGLRNIHIFGLANVMRRPIILLDSLSGIQSSGDYSGIFLPGLHPPEECGKGGVLNKPLCIAWSSAGRNHYIALVGVKGRPLPRVPDWMIPKVWGMPQEQAAKYIQTEPDGSVVIGGDKCLTDKYILRLVDCMEEVFMESHTVSTALVADVQQYIFKSSGYVGVNPEIVLDQTQRSVAAKQLFRCLTCDAIMDWVADPEFFKPGGMLYKIAVNSHKTLDPTKLYSFPVHGYVCRYDAEKDELIPEKERGLPTQCQFCQGTQLRHVNGDGSIEYINGDRTKTQSNSTKCTCGYKHFYNGKEYDNLPEIIPISLDWGGKVIQEKVDWFQYETDINLNSNVFEVASQVVQQHFPGEFGSERMVQKVVDTILRQTAIKEASEVPPLTMGGTFSQATTGQDDTDATWRSDTASKIILTGHKKKTIHKEELTMSASERLIRKNVEAKASHLQKRKTDELAAAASVPVTPGRTENVKGSPTKAKTATSISPSGSPHSPLGDHNTPTTPTSGQGDADMKKVRVTTSDGRQLTLCLPADITYKGLKDILASELDVPSHRQKIKHGFPPKVLQAPPDGSEDNALHIHHGDKLTVEIMPPKPTDTRSSEAGQVWPAKVPESSSWSGFEANAHDQSAQSMLKSLDQLQSGSQDSLDTAVASLVLMATLTGKDIWSYVQGMPHLFSVGGLYYQQVKRDLGLSDGKHCTLPSLTGKVFRYTAADDRLELCLEPHGHFAVEPGIEQKILKGGTASVQMDGLDIAGSAVKDALATGSSGVAINRPMEMPKQSKSQSPFSGQGHSLLSGSENIRMPHDLEMTSHPHHHHKAMNFHELNHQAPECIEEEEEGGLLAAIGGASNTSSEPQREPVFKRLGPGVTVLSDETEDINNYVNTQKETCHILASQLESFVKNTENDVSMDCAGSPSRTHNQDEVSAVRSPPVEQPREPPDPNVTSEPMDST